MFSPIHCHSSIHIFLIHRFFLAMYVRNSYLLTVIFKQSNIFATVYLCNLKFLQYSAALTFKNRASYI